MTFAQVSSRQRLVGITLPHLVVAIRGKPKAALVSLDDLERLKMLEKAQAVREGLAEYKPGVTVPSEQVKPGQEWFWTEEWQAAERKAEADLAAGRYETFDNDDDFLVSLGTSWRVVRAH